MDKKAIFNKVYANLPLGSREEIILVVNDQPITWNAARLEVEFNTSLGNEIVEKLFKMGILKHE